jgi:anti-anti-sigma factor
MPFKVNFEVTESGVARITLSGELDASVSQVFRDEVEKAVQHRAKRLVLLLGDLEYIASAGIRVLLFAKQKMGAKVDIYVIGAQEQVMNTLQKTGLHHSFVAADKYDPATMDEV